MENQAESAKPKGHQVIPHSKSIDMTSVRSQKNKPDYPSIDTAENDSEHRSHTMGDRYFMNRSMTTSLYHCVTNVATIQEVKMNVFGDHDLVLSRSKVIRFLIIFKVLISIVYYIASPISLIILIPELIGYLGIRKLLNKATLLYGIWLFVELMLRVIAVVILGLDWVSLNNLKIAVFAISAFMIPVNIVGISLVLRFYNAMNEIDEVNRQTILFNSGLSFLPP